MKKILLAAAVCALASINSFGAPACVDGVLTGVATPCTVTNGSYAWDLSNIGVFDVSSNGFVPGATTTSVASALTVSFATQGSTGFSITYTVGSPYNTWDNQDVNWLSGAWVTAANVDSNVVRIGLGNVYGVAGNNAYMGFEKEIQDQSANTVHTSLNLSYPNGGSAFSGSDYIQTTNAFSAPNLSINDRLVFDAKDIGAPTNLARQGSVVSYTNYFYAAEPQTGVPEPMTFVLMGAGLVGIAALRRRNG